VNVNADLQAVQLNDVLYIEPCVKIESSPVSNTFDLNTAY